MRNVIKRLGNQKNKIYKVSKKLQENRRLIKSVIKDTFLWAYHEKTGVKESDHP